MGTWESFQWLLIRIALFLALLTLGPSIALISFDLVLYIYRTTFGSVTYVNKSEKEDVRKLVNKPAESEDTDLNRPEVSAESQSVEKEG